MKRPPVPPLPPNAGSNVGQAEASDADEVARQKARLEQQMLEAKLEILRSHRQRREAAVSRRFSFLLVFALSGFVAFVLDRRGWSPAVSVLGCVLTIVTVGVFWAYRK